METVSWVNKSDRYAEFSVCDLWKANNVTMTKAHRYVIIVSTSKGVERTDHRYIMNMFGETLALASLISETKEHGLTVNGISDPDNTQPVLITKSKALSRDELKAVYFDEAQADDSFDRLINSLESKLGHLDFIHIEITN